MSMNLIFINQDGNVQFLAQLQANQYRVDTSRGVVSILDDDGAEVDEFTLYAPLDDLAVESKGGV